MISLIVFYFHIVGFALGFSFQYKKEDFRSAVSTLFFFILIFTVGWSIVGMILRAFVAPEGINFYFDRNGIILIILSFIEIIFYRFYFLDEK